MTWAEFSPAEGCGDVRDVQNILDTNNKEPPERIAVHVDASIQNDICFRMRCCSTCDSATIMTMVSDGREHSECVGVDLAIAPASSQVRQDVDASPPIFTDHVDKRAKL